MGVSYIPVEPAHVCETPLADQAYHLGAGAPSRAAQVDAGIYWKCHCGARWQLVWRGFIAGSWWIRLDWRHPLRRWKHRRAVRRGLLMERDHDEIVKELEELLADVGTSDEGIGRRGLASSDGVPSTGNNRSATPEGVYNSHLCGARWWQECVDVGVCDKPARYHYWP